MTVQMFVDRSAYASKESHNCVLIYKRMGATNLNYYFSMTTYVTQWQVGYLALTHIFSKSVYRCEMDIFRNLFLWQVYLISQKRDSIHEGASSHRNKHCSI